MTTSATRLTLLIADDDMPAREALASILVRKFPDVVIYTAGDGRTAWEYFRKYQPDIIITDIIMPELNGIQLARQIKATGSGSKLIAITGMSDLENSDDSEAVGMLFDHTIMKPIGFGELFAAIELCFAELCSNR